MAPSDIMSFSRKKLFLTLWFGVLSIWFWGLTPVVWQGFFFLSLLSHNFKDQLSSNFYRFVIWCMCWDTPSEKTEKIWDNYQKCPVFLSLSASCKPIRYIIGQTNFRLHLNFWHVSCSKFLLSTPDKDTTHT